ncbi:MAG TPA: acyltransferase [Candidatus Eisenbacteria bacterium]|nr:acyltransferase [Candidatus Eisenbacteria bacterium]
MKERFVYIDFIRALSIIGVIAIHTLSFSLGSSINLFIWNFLQFVVGAFVFCSGFVHSHYESKFTSFPVIFSWYKKRAIRILLPFYIYFCVHFLLFFFFPTFFTHFGLQKSFSYIVGSIFLYGGINASWLPLLFLQLTVLTPLLFLLNKKRILWIYIICCVIVTAVGTLWFVPYSWYRGTMWIGWSLIFLLGILAPKIKSTGKLFAGLTLLGTILSSFLLFLFSNFHHSINFTDNKYPPNLYYLSYAVAGTSLLFLLSKKFIPVIPEWTYEYISKKSYSLFFIHYIVLDFILNSFHRLGSLAIFIITVLISLIISVAIDWILFSSKSYIKI